MGLPAIVLGGFQQNRGQLADLQSLAIAGLEVVARMGLCCESVARQLGNCCEVVEVN